MKTLILIVAASGLGVAIGVAVSVYQEGWPTRLSLGDMNPNLLIDSEADADNLLAPPPEGAGAPEARVPEETFDFGAMTMGEKGRHAFDVYNDGDYPLKLQVLDSSCQCNVASLTSAEIAAGGKSSVVLEWQVEQPEQGKFRHWATVATNDRKHGRLIFTITGQIQMPAWIRPSDSSLSFGQDEGESVNFHVYSTGYRFNVTGFHFSNSTIADHFSVTHRPLEPMESEDPQDIGYVVTIKIKPGLPPGRFTQRLSIDTDRETLGSRLIHTIRGEVVGDVSIGGGKGWSGRYGILSMGRVDRNTGASTTLYLLLRGPHKEKISFKVKHTSPEGLVVRPGEPRPIGDGKVWRMPLVIAAPKGMKPVNLLANPDRLDDPIGEIVLLTGHPEQKELAIPVSIAVAD